MSLHEAMGRLAGEMVGEEQMAEIRGGFMDGTYVAINLSMPMGAKMCIGGEVYVREKGLTSHALILVFSQLETDKYRTGLKKNSGVN